MSSTPTPATDTPDTRQELIRAARDLYLRQGLAGLSMRKVARAAGVSAPAIYRHFEGKEALLIAVCEEGFRLFAEYLWRSLHMPTAAGRLAAAGEQYMRFGLEQAPYYRFMFMTPAEDLGFSAAPASTQKKVAPTFQFLIDRVRECIDAGALGAGDPVELATTIWAHCHGLVSLHLAGQLRPDLVGDLDFAAFYQRSVARLVGGMRP